MAVCRTLSCLAGAPQMRRAPRHGSLACRSLAFEIEIWSAPTDRRGEIETLSALVSQGCRPAGRSFAPSTRGGLYRLFIHTRSVISFERQSGRRAARRRGLRYGCKNKAVPRGCSRHQPWSRRCSWMMLRMAAAVSSTDRTAHIDCGPFHPHEEAVGLGDLFLHDLFVGIGRCRRFIQRREGAGGGSAPSLSERDLAAPPQEAQCRTRQDIRHIDTGNQTIR